MTVGVTPYERLQAWLEAAGFRRESALIEFALRVRTDVQREYLRSVYDNIEAFGHILSRWESEGTNCHGMADLAAAWSRYAPPTGGLGGIPARELAHQPVDRNFKEARRDKVIDDRRDALYLLMQSMVPQGPDSKAHLTLRAWIFLHGLQLALHGQTTDENLSEACRVLRLAAYELPGGVWRQALEPFGQWSRTHDRLTEHIKGLRERGQLEKHPRTARATARICRFAEGDRRHLGEPDADATVPRPLQPVTPAPTPAERLEATSVELPPYLPLGYLAQSDDAELDDLELSAVEVDPEASPEAQSLYARSARLQLGAAARLLAWDWPQVLPPERKALEQLVATALAEPVGRFVRLLASFTSFAMTAGLSLEEALQVPVRGSQPVPGDIDWLIDLARGHATRRPPRRTDQRRPSAEQMDHLCWAAEALHVQLPEPVLAIWRSEASACSGLHRLGQLWNDSEATASAAFRQWVGNNGPTRRLQPSMLRHVLGQRAYEATGDHVLARLLPSTPDSGLPAATVYAAFEACELGKVWTNLATTPPTPSVARLNAAGSLMDPNGDEQFADAFRNARRAIETLRAPERWIEFHNAVALYWDAALRAATGIRPVNDLWVSERDFDWGEGFVYVDDKASPVAASGRLIPLPTVLCGHLREHYLRLHLPWVLERLRQVGTPVPRTPFLFIVGGSGSNLRVEPIENSQRRSSDIGAPLPLNVFRHRLRTLLHRDQTVDKEVVDSLMGHGDGATLTHGDHSMRTWKTDAAVLRPALDRLYGQLSVAAPVLRTDFEGEPCFRPVDPVTPLASLRRRDRSPGRPKHLREAVRVIERCLEHIEQHGPVQADAKKTPQTLDTESTKPLDPLLKRLAKLSSTQLDSLSVALMKSDTQFVDPTGVVRYQFLLRLAQEASSRFGIRFAIRKRYGIREIEDSPFRPEAAGALAAIRDLRTCLDTQFDSIRSASRVSLGLALLLLQIDLCAVSRIAHRPLLASLLEVPDRWRVARLAGEFHLEWSPQANLRTELDAACMRFQISARAAWLLTEIVAPRARRMAAWSDSTPATSLFAAIVGPATDSAPIKPLTNAAVLERVVTLVDQANIIELPGSLAGYLGGRLMTSSLGWGEWLQVRQGRWIEPTSITIPVDAGLEAPPADNAPAKCPRFAGIDDDPDGDTIDPTPHTRIKRIDSTLIPPQDRARNARDVVQVLQRSIRELRETRGLTKRRQKRAKSLARLIENRSAGVSSTVRLLCSWAIDMLIRPGRSRKLATSSVERYFVALSPRFKTIGSDVDIDGMDDEQIEAFYRDILDLSPAKARGDVHAALRSFHGFAHRTAGLPAIDWSAVAVDLDTALCAPGFVDECSYLRFVRQLGSCGSWPHALAWQLQCFVILCYRFGLRAGECAGLTRADLVWPDDNVPHVLVRRNRLRALKTSAARRAVPLLFTLTEDEATALRRLRDSRLPVFGRLDEELPLFALPERPDAPLDDLAVRRHLNMALQQFTGQRGTTLHDLRHSFAAHVWAATQPSGWEVLDRAAPDQDAQQVKVLLLGAHAGAATRRAPWALARLMGHAHPRTAMQSYVHSMSDAHRKLVDVSNVPCPELARLAVIRCINLDAAADFIARKVPDVSRPEPDAAACLVALWYLAEGRTDAEVQDDTRLRLHVVQYLRAASVALVAALTSSERGGMRKHLRPDTGSARLSPAGLTALVHAVAFPRMRDGLKKLGAGRGSLPAAVGSVGPEEWALMVDDRREISLWTQGQFELFSLAIRVLTPETRSVVLKVRKHNSSDDPNTGELAELARATGWLPSPEGSAASKSPPLCQSLTAVETGLPPVRLPSGGIWVDRAVLTFSTPPGGHVLDRIELIVCALCLCALARQQLDGPDTMRSMVG